jgi:hypothetical protein
MPQEPIATLIQSNDPEGRDVTWKEVGQTPTQFLQWIIKRLAVDFGRVRSIIPIYIGKTNPDGANSGKIHIKDTNPPRIGVNTEAGYKYFDMYPRNVIMGWRGSKPIPSYMTTVPDLELEQLGLPKNVPNSLVWVVYPE